MPHYKLQHSQGVSFVKTNETISIIVKRMDDRVVVESNPFPFNHRPENAELMQISEHEFEREYIQSVHEITKTTFKQEA